VNSHTFFYTRKKYAIIMLKILDEMVQTGTAWVTRQRVLGEMVQTGTAWVTRQRILGEMV
jgi:hypothetical protein